MIASTTFTNNVADTAQPESALQINLDLRLGCDRHQKTILKHAYTHYPLGISKVFRLEDNSPLSTSKRAYLYRTNSSPGLLAGDRLKTYLHLEADSAVYLLDQSATKVHSMPDPETCACTMSEIEIGDRATLEYLQEPTILFADSDFAERTKITMHSESALSLGTIMVPGRLARGEKYDFRRYQSQIEIVSSTGQLLLNEKSVIARAIAQQCLYFSTEPILGRLIVVLPESIANGVSLTQLNYQVKTLMNGDLMQGLKLSSVTSIQDRGFLFSLTSANVHRIQTGFKTLLDSLRRLQQQSPLPYSV